MLTMRTGPLIHGSFVFFTGSSSPFKSSPDVGSCLILVVPEEPVSSAIASYSTIWMSFISTTCVTELPFLFGTLLEADFFLLGENFVSVDASLLFVSDLTKEIF